MNNSEALTTLIVGGRTAKEYSQRELARRVGISNSSLNDIENGRVAKPDPEILKKISEELDLSLQQLLKAAGYNEVMSWFSHDEFKNKSTKDLKNTIEKCRLFKRSGDTAAVYPSGERTQPVRSDLGKECIRIVTDRRGCGCLKRL